MNRRQLIWLTVLASCSLLFVVLTMRIRNNQVSEQPDWAIEPSQVSQGPEFDLSNATIPVGEISSGGPPKDGIPAIRSPQTVPAAQATFLKANDRVIGVAIGNEARAYPIAILNHHEIVNDSLGGTPIAVTYCPLCDSAIVFDRVTPLGEREFGVSGLLYNSNVLMYDRAEAESLWSQMMMQGVSGPGAGMKLKVLPAVLTSWKIWRDENPATTVISTETGHSRNYDRNPYLGYFRQADLMFPVRPINAKLRLKELVLGVWDDEVKIAIPASAFGRRSTEIERTINGKKITFAFDRKTRSIRVLKADEGLRWVNSFWFAWYAFHPQTQILTAN